MAGGDDLIDIENTFSEVAVALFAPGTVEGTLQKIVDLAAHAVDGCAAAGVLLVGNGGGPATLAASSPLAVTVDQMQIDTGDGPCLTSAHDGSTVYANDLLDDDRWPDFATAAVEAGVRTVLAYALPTGRPAALNLYGHLPEAFGASARAQGALFATLARLALDTAKERALEAERALNLFEALRTRELIGQAQGILIERERISGEQAFEVLRRASQHLNVKLREVAAALVETGESPDTGSGPPPGPDASR